MKLQVMPSSFESDGSASLRQHLPCIVIDDRLAVDAGSLAFACSDEQRAAIRDIVISHAHLDHIAGLPSFVDDNFTSLEGPIRVHGTGELLRSLSEHVFNDVIYPRFTEIRNDHGPVLEFVEFSIGRSFAAAGYEIMPIAVEHLGPSAGFIISDEQTAVAISGDMSATDEFWSIVEDRDDVKAIFTECSFPDAMADLAQRSGHLTPATLAGQIGRLPPDSPPVFVVNIKPMYRESVVRELTEKKMRVEVALPGRIYEF